MNNMNNFSFGSSQRSRFFYTDGGVYYFRFTREVFYPLIVVHVNHLE